MPQTTVQNPKTLCFQCYKTNINIQGGRTSNLVALKI